MDTLLKGNQMEDRSAGANPTASPPRPPVNPQRLAANPPRTTIEKRLTPYGQAMVMVDVCDGAGTLE